MIKSLPVDISQIRTHSANQQSYTDLNSLQAIKVTGKEDKDLALRQVAQQFESMFMDMMLKSMRSANEVFGKDNPLNTSEMKHHQEMYDKQLSLSLSQASTVGLADAFYRQMKRNYVVPDVAISSATNNINKDDLALRTITNVSASPAIPSLPISSQVTSSEVNNRVEKGHYGLKHDQRMEDAGLLKMVKTPQDFINAITPHAKKAAEALGVDYRVLIAQSALETGWGEHVIRDQYGNQSFNLFNIKADSRWEGKSVAVPTIEYVDGVAQREKAHFRRYADIDESFNDYKQFLSQSRYEKALSVSENSHQFVQELQNAGYATDPNYAQKIQSILKNEQLWSRN